MKKITLFTVLFAFVCAMFVSGCGYSSQDNEAIGQVKKIKNVTPIICGKRVDVDISLGVMRNGVGSMSHQDIWLTVREKSYLPKILAASESGKIIKFKYDEVRTFNWCWEDRELTSVEIIE